MTLTKKAAEDILNERKLGYDKAFAMFNHKTGFSSLYENRVVSKHARARSYARDQQTSIVTSA